MELIRLYLAHPVAILILLVVVIGGVGYLFKTILK